MDNQTSTPGVLYAQDFLPLISYMVVVIKSDKWEKSDESSSLLWDFALNWNLQKHQGQYMPSVFQYGS